jgi:hypothetical protein
VGALNKYTCLNGERRLTQRNIDAVTYAVGISVFVTSACPLVYRIVIGSKMCNSEHPTSPVYNQNRIRSKSACGHGDLPRE